MPLQSNPEDIWNMTDSKQKEEECVVEMDCESAPAGQRSRKFLLIADTISTMLCLISTGIGMADLFFPVPLPVAAG